LLHCSLARIRRIRRIRRIALLLFCS